MNAYAAVSHPVRRKLEEMLDTWEQPVPGSIDQRPVFAAETIRPIRAALQGHRNRVAERFSEEQARNQQLMARQRPMVVQNTQWRNSPAAHQGAIQYPLPSQIGYPQPNVTSIPHQVGDASTFLHKTSTNSYWQPRPLYPPQNQYVQPQHLPQQAPQHFQQPISYSNHSPAFQPLESLNRDIAELVITTRDQLAANVYDTGLKERLTALLQLQDFMRMQQVAPNQIQAIRDQITALSAPMGRPPTQMPYASPSQAPQQHQLPHMSYNGRPTATPQPQTPTVNSQASIESKNLADIIARAQRAPATPSNQQAPLQQPQSLNNPQVSMPQAPGMDLLAALRAQGLLPAGSTTPVNDSKQYVPTSTNTLPPSTLTTGLTRDTSVNDVELTSASLKRYVRLMSLWLRLY